MKEAPNRFNSLWGAGRAAELSDSHDKAISYYTNLVRVSDRRNTHPAFLAAKSISREEQIACDSVRMTGKPEVKVNCS